VPRLVHGGLAALVVAVALASAQGAAAEPEIPAEAPDLPGVKIERPHVGLSRVLHRGQLVVDYSCMEACRPFMRLRVAGIAISIFDPPGGPTAGSRAAVFKLDRKDRRTIVGHARDGVATFRLGAVFTNNSSARATRALRFRLRR
jgi:hypothetical protein